MAGEEIRGEVQSSMGKDSSISREMGSVQDISHVDKRYVLVGPLERGK